MNGKKPPIAARLRLSAFDPGLVRLRGAGRAALSVLSIWLVLRFAMPLLFPDTRAPVALLGVLSGIIFQLFIIDLKPSNRRVSLWLAPFPFAVAFILASCLEKYFWLNNLILLSLFFFSYFFRRYGTRYGELALVATIGYYFGCLFHPPTTFIPEFLATVLVSVAIVYLWQFVILPYDPTRALHRSIRAFYHNVAASVAVLRQGLHAEQWDNHYTEQLQRQHQCVHQNRRVIEDLFSAAVSPTLWSQARLDRLQVAMFKAERGLEILVEATTHFTNLPDHPFEDILSVLMEALETLEADLWNMSSQEDQTRLSELGDSLQILVKSRLEEAHHTDWVYPLLRIVIASGQLARSVAEINKIETAWVASKVGETSVKSPPFKPTWHQNSSEKKSFTTLHPTTILGFQAVFAAGLAMLAAYFLKLDQPNLVYWTAFVVIAGSTGESLRRIGRRVLGVVAGTLSGVFLALVLPDDLALVVLAVMLSAFMTVFTLPISYARMVFYLNIAILLIITTLNGPAPDLLLIRPLNTLVGAAIAALVVGFVLPIHTRDRFSAALAAFLGEVKDYIDIYVTMWLNVQAPGDLEAQATRVDISYRKLERNLPGVVYEYNPLSRAQSRLTSQVTMLATLRSYVTQLNDNVGADPGRLDHPRDASSLTAIQARIHQTIEAVNGFLANRHDVESDPDSVITEQVGQENILQGLFSTEPGSAEVLYNRALYHLKRIHDTLLQIASDLGVPPNPA